MQLHSKDSYRNTITWNLARTQMGDFMSLLLFFSISSTKRTELNGSLCAHYFRRPIGGKIDALCFLFLELLFDPKVCDSQSILGRCWRGNMSDWDKTKFSFDIFFYGRDEVKVDGQEKTNKSTFSFIEGAQPSFSLIRVLSEFRPRTPSGPGMCWMGSFLSSKLRTISAISFMLTISSLPIFTGSRKSDFVNLQWDEISTTFKLVITDARK